jgi:peptide deformylase
MLTIILNMPVRELVHIEDGRLRQKAQPIEVFEPSLDQLVEDMVDTMRAHRGVGLAGPQIGEMKRIFVAHIPWPDSDEQEPVHPEAGKTFVLINPVVISSSSTCMEGEEGCLSIPGWRGLVERPDSVAVEALTPVGEKVLLRADGYLARIFLHEIDHLDGVLFTDHISDQTKLWQIPDLDESPLAAEVEASA